jgi:hypothetical protein
LRGARGEQRQRGPTAKSLTGPPHQSCNEILTIIAPPLKFSDFVTNRWLATVFVFHHPPVKVGFLVDEGFAKRKAYCL